MAPSAWAAQGKPQPPTQGGNGLSFSGKHTRQAEFHDAGGEFSRADQPARVSNQVRRGGKSKLPDGQGGGRRGRRDSPRHRRSAKSAYPSIRRIAANPHAEVERTLRPSVLVRSGRKGWRARNRGPGGGQIVNMPRACRRTKRTSRPPQIGDPAPPLLPLACSPSGAFRLLRTRKVTSSSLRSPTLILDFAAWPQRRRNASPSRCTASVRLPFGTCWGPAPLSNCADAVSLCAVAISMSPR